MSHFMKCGRYSQLLLVDMQPCGCFTQFMKFCMPTQSLHDPPHPTPSWCTPPHPFIMYPTHPTPPLEHFLEEHSWISWAASLCLPFGTQKYTSHWLNISCAYTRGIAAYICKIWSFYDQTCHWEGCTQTLMPMPMTTTTMDRAWLHRLITKWAKNPKFYTSTMYFILLFI